MSATTKLFFRCVRAGLAIACVTIAVNTASACPSCFGSGASGPMVDGMNTAILVMLGIIGSVLLAISFFFVMMIRRSRLRREQSSDTLFLNDQGILQWKSF